MRKQFFYITIMVLLAIFLVPNIFTSTKIPIAQAQGDYEPPENGAGYIGPNTPAYNPKPNTTPGSEPSCGPASTMYCVKDGCAGYRTCTCGTPPPGSNTTASCTWGACITNCGTSTDTTTTRYSCNTSTWTCSTNSTGAYTSLSSCQSACVASTTTRYSCNTSTWTCSTNSTGAYTSLSSCQSACVASTTTRYSCNTSTWTCYQTSGGEYSSPSVCQNSCVRPPCTISYFELPARAWVGYSITGRWAASVWCEDCDVTCTPYPECVWKQESIGIGNIGANEYKFKFEQSGTYTYTLTCYGQTSEDQDEKTTTIQAINLPWWREIIPVLPGFLRGLWK